MFFTNLLPATRERIEVWREQRMAKPILKALGHPDTNIRCKAVHALGEMVAARALPADLLLETYRRIVQLAINLGTADGNLLWECVYALRHFDGREARDFYHSLLERDPGSLPTDRNVLDWVIIGLSEGSGDAESCQLLLRLIDQGRFSHHLTSEFREHGGTMLRKAITAGGIDSDVLHLYCQLAAKDAPVHHDADYLLYRAFGANTDPYAREIVRGWQQSKHDAVRNYARKFLGEDEKLPDSERKLVEMLKAVAAGKEHATHLSEHAGKMCATALPVLRRFFEQDRSGPLGRAAVIGLHFLPPKLALPLITEALQSDWPAVRHYAAEYLILKRNRSNNGRDLARRVLPNEKDEGIRRMLEKAAENTEP